MINKSHIQKNIESFIYDRLRQDSYKVNNLDSVELLTWNRLDLAFKLFYLQYKNLVPNLALDVYKHDIRSQTLGSFEEYGNKEKTNFDKYVKEFDTTFEDIKSNGFDDKKTLIPLSNQSTILNGSHRTASAIYLNIPVSCVQTEIDIMTCDYKYFYERKVPNDILDIVTQIFTEYAKDTYIAFLWPSGNHSKKEVVDKFSNIVYHKKIKLTPQGGLNLLIELYRHMDWVGDKSSGFKGAKQKLIECFPSYEPFDVVVFQSDSIEKVRALKEDVRKIYNIGFSSIHITDTKEEAIRISKLIFNENGLHFLNYAQPYKYDLAKEKIEKLREFVLSNNIVTNDILLDSSIVLSLYGLREAGDIDYLIDNNCKIKQINDEFEPHDNELKFHDKAKLELIYNPKNHFWYYGLKYVSFNQLYKMKKNRNEVKDRNDCAMMESLIEDNRYKRFTAKIKQSYLYFKIKASKKLRELPFRILKTLKLYEVVRYLYRKVRSRV